MAESYVDTVANELADLALADEQASGDIAIVDLIGEILGASSQTLQETYLTAIRVRRAEKRARALLAERVENGYEAAPTPEAAPLQGLSDEEKEVLEATEDDSIVTNPDGEDEPQEPVAPTAMPRRVKR